MWYTDYFINKEPHLKIHLKKILIYLYLGQNRMDEQRRTDVQEEGKTRQEKDRTVR